MCRAASEIAAPGLLAFDGFEQRFEIALTKTAAAFSLDDFVEQRGPVLDGPREDLEHVSLVVAIYEYTEVLQFGEGLVDLAHPRHQVVIIRGRHPEDVN